MRLMTTTAILALAGLLAAPALASTDGRPGRAAMPQMPAFAQIDADGDGAVTLDEWRSHLTARAAERRSARVGAQVDRLMAGDADGDGALSADELTARIDAMIDERRAAMAERRAEGRPEMGHHGMRGQQMRGHQMRGHQARGPGARAWGMDADERVVRSFQRIDRDGDGRITEAEYDRVVTRMQEMRERRAERMERRSPRPRD